MDGEVLSNEDLCRHPSRHGEETRQVPATNGVVSAIDGAADEQPPKRGCLSEPDVPNHGPETRPKRTVRQAPSRDYEDITNSAPLNLPAPTASDQPTDLQFAAYILTNLCNPHLHAINHPFLSPVSVDSCPDYYDTIKNPMDLETMSVKLSGGKYSSSEEMKKDFERMIQNCNEYNPVNHPIRDCGIRLRRYFEEWWNGKERWERAFAREVAIKQAEKELDDDEDDDDHTEDGDEGEEIDPLLLNAVPTGDREVDGQNRKRLGEEIEKIKARSARHEAREKEKPAEKGGKIS